MQKELYLVVQHTPSVVSKIIRCFTHARYNHIAVSLDAELEQMYTFGRKYTYFPWYGGFVRESTQFGSLKRFTKTEAIILELTVDEETYEGIRARLEKMFKNAKTYHYDTLGLLAAIFEIKYKRDRHYYCSEFVRDLLVEFDVEGSDNLRPIVRPMDFLHFPNSREIYRGRLHDFDYMEIAEEKVPETVQ